MSTLLRNALADYLDTVSERAFDLPFLMLLSAMGYSDVHLTHGSVEFGKDFIAKRREDELLIQYSFQTKAGDIRLSDWRSDIQGQLFGSVINPLSHPSFDSSLPHRSVLVTTGDLRGNVRIEFGQLRASVRENLNNKDIAHWGSPQLLDMLTDHGLGSMIQTTAINFMETGQFLLHYSRALSGELTTREIEVHSRHWLEVDLDLDHLLLRCTIEAEVLSSQCEAHGRYYEASHGQLALIRTLCALSYKYDTSQLETRIQEALKRLCSLCLTTIRKIESLWLPHRDLLRVSLMEITTYLVQCSRIMETAAIVYFATDNPDDRIWTTAFLDEFISSEPGCGRPLSNRYAITIILAVLVLCDSGRTEKAKQLLRSSTVWLCDRHEYGIGLASLDADEVRETETLIGYPYEFMGSTQPPSSILATALGDLAAYLGDGDLYRDIVNDVKACNIRPEYWQPRDSAGACRFEAEDVVSYPSVEFNDNLADPYSYADHIFHEPSAFHFVTEFGPATAVAIMVLLRDRYFPRIWDRLTPTFAGPATGDPIDREPA